MKTRVVNLRQEPFDVYIGRASRGAPYGADGVFGNPIVAGNRCFVCRQVHTVPSDTLPCYRVWLLEKLQRDVPFRARVLMLHGKTLGCFCHPRPCHGAILAEWIDAQFANGLGCST